MVTLAELLAEGRARLAASSPSARLDAELLLCHLLDKPRSYLYAWPEHAVSEETLTGYEGLLKRRAAGEPIAHLLGYREFWSLALEVTPATLIPRPETELLVEAALARMAEGETLKVADLGTGSGAIALAVASERPAASVVAVERSADALAVARGNGERLGIGNVEFRAGSWFDPLAGERFDLILANPPYIAAGDPHLSEGDVRFEPLTALVAGADGLDDIRHLIATAPNHLNPGGWLILEHGYDQGAVVTQLLLQQGFSEVTDLVDGGGHGRIAVGSWPGLPN